MNVSKGTVEKYALLFVVCGIVFAANYAQYQVSGLAHLVVSDLHLTSAEFSAVLFAPFVPAVVFGMPVGVCADRYGVKVLVFIASAISAIAAVARAECASFATLFTATMLLGAAPCVVNAIVLKVLGSAFGGETDRAMGWFYAAGSGGVACSLATSPLFATSGRAYALAAVLFAVFGLLWLLVAPSADVLQAADGLGVQGAEPASSSASAFATVIKMPMVWLVAILLGVALASATAYSGYLVSALEVSTEPQVAGLLASFVTLGSIVGSVAGPYARAQFGDYRVFMAIAAMAGSALMWAGEAFVSQPSVGLMFAIGVSTAVAGPVVQSLPYMLPEVREGLAGSAGGVVSTVSLGLTFLIPVALSFCIGESYETLLFGCAVLFGATALASPFLPSPDSLM